jgi:hypothetical protein
MGIDGCVEKRFGTQTSILKRQGVICELFSPWRFLLWSYGYESQNVGLLKVKPLNISRGHDSGFVGTGYRARGKLY